MPLRFQPWTQIKKIKHLAIVNQPNASAFVAHRLMTGRRQINDAQSPVGKAYPRHAVRSCHDLHPIVIRPTMHNGRVHRFQLVPVSKAGGATDATH